MRLAIELGNRPLIHLAPLAANVVNLHSLGSLQSNKADMVLLLHRMRNATNLYLKLAAGTLLSARGSALLLILAPLINRHVLLLSGIVSLRLQKLHTHTATRWHHSRIISHKDYIATFQATIKFNLFHNAKLLKHIHHTNNQACKKIVNFARKIIIIIAMLLIITAIILAILGIVGGIVPVLPGPPLSWLALLCAHFAASPENKFSTFALAIWLVLAIIITIMDYLLPGYMAKLTGGHRGAERGALVGLIVGIFFTPIGMVLGCFLGAFLGELIVEGESPARALSAATGAFLAFILTTGIKVIFSVIALWQVIKHLL